MTTKFHSGSGNVFVGAGFPPDEAAHLLMRSDLISAVTEQIERQGFTQTQAAKVLGVSQPRISDLVRRKIDRFSIDALVQMLSRMGMSVEVRTRRTPKSA